MRVKNRGSGIKELTYRVQAVSAILVSKNSYYEARTEVNMSKNIDQKTAEDVISNEIRKQGIRCHAGFTGWSCRR